MENFYRLRIKAEEFPIGFEVVTTECLYFHDKHNAYVKACEYIKENALSHLDQSNLNKFLKLVEKEDYENAIAFSNARQDFSYSCIVHIEWCRFSDNKI